MSTPDRGPTVIVVGGGFGGLYASRNLGRAGVHLISCGVYSVRNGVPLVSLAM